MTIRMHLSAWLFVLFLFSQNSFSQCSATFTVLPGSSNTFTFQGTTVPSNTNTTYSWNYGDGNIGNGQNVTHQYTSNGNYTVTLNIITSSPSCSASVSQTIYAGPPPCSLTANFTYTVGPGGVVNFSDASTGTTSATTFTWNYGDGNTGWGAATTNTYASNGTYNIYYYVYDSNLSCFDTVVIPVTISNLPCNINAGFTWVDNNGVVSFNNTTTPPNSQFTCNWGFGDGGTSTQLFPSHTYSATGNYNATLTVIQGSCISTFTSVVTVSITPCNVSANFTYTISNNGQVNFTNTSTNTFSNNIYWNFGDGNSAWGANNPSNNYSANGTYTVTLKVYGSTINCWDSVSIPLTITNVTCYISNGPLSFTGYEGTNGQATFYSNTSNTNLNYNWSFGNGTFSSLSSPTATYASPGTYTVTLTVSDPTNSACSASTTDTIQIVYYPCSYNAAFTSTLSSNTLSVTSMCTGTSSGVTMVYWNWGDGNYSPGTMNSNASHSYSVNGTYTVSLFIQDSTANFFQACIDSSSIVINIGGAGCPVNSNFSLQKDTSQLYSWFAYPNYQSNIVSATWSWGDGTSSNSLYPSHTYSAAGWYNICLTVSLSCGSQSTTCYNNYLNRQTQTNTQIFIQVMNQPVLVKQNESSLATLKLLPNPSDGEFAIEHPGVAVDEIRIYNNLGECVYIMKTKEITNQQEKINIESLQDGCYSINIHTSKGIINKKLVLTR